MVLNTGGQSRGQFTVYNPSRINLNDVVVDASKVLGASITLSYNGVTGASVTIPRIPPLSTATVDYQASANCPIAAINSSINVSANYVYFKVVPALSMSDNDFVFSGSVGLGTTHHLTVTNTGYTVATATTLSAPTHNWVQVTRDLGDLGLNNIAPLTLAVAPPAGTSPGTYTENLVLSAGNGTPANQLQLTITIGGDGSVNMHGVYTQGSVPPSTGTTGTGVPVSVTLCSDPPPQPVGVDISFVPDGGGLEVAYGGGGGDSPGLTTILPPTIVPPPVPVPQAHEIVLLDIPQKTSLERQAFIADLKTTNTTSSDLQGFQVTLNVTDPSGAVSSLNGLRYVDLFAITAPTDAGYTATHGIAPAATGESAWTLVPSAGLGGSDPAGTKYEVSATYTYTLNGTPFSVTTSPVEITILPMPQLVVNYYVPRDVKAGRPVKLGVIVQNVGDGPATDLVIESGQPVITQNLSGLLITFGLLGSEVKGQSVPTRGLTLDFGTVAAHSQTYGYWLLSVDLDGQFTAFTANYTQQDFRGVKLGPLIVAVHTNIIVQGDVVPAGGQVLQVVAPLPDVDPNALLDLETGVSTPVSTIYVDDTVHTTTGCETTSFQVLGNGGYVLPVVPDYWPGLDIGSVMATYADGTSALLDPKRPGVAEYQRDWSGGEPGRSAEGCSWCGDDVRHHVRRW